MRFVCDKMSTFSRKHTINSMEIVNPIRLIHEMLYAPPTARAMKFIQWAIANGRDYFLFEFSAAHFVLMQYLILNELPSSNKKAEIFVEFTTKMVSVEWLTIHYWCVVNELFINMYV